MIEFGIRIRISVVCVDKYISLCAKRCEDDKRQIYKHCLHGEASNVERV